MGAQGRWLEAGANIGRWLLAAGLSLVLVSCGGDGDSGSSSNSSASAARAAGQSLNDEVYAYYKDWYLWYDTLPQTGVNNFNPNNYASVDALVEALRKQPEDRFSYVDTVGRYLAFFNDGTVTGYGVGLTRRANNTIFVQFTDENSPARLGGLVRGQQVLAINGFTIAQLDAGTGGGYDGQLGTTNTGVAARFTITDAGGQRDITISSATYRSKTVLDARLLSATVGYLSVKSFLQPTVNEIAAAFNDPAWNAVTDLILDMRFNGGGSVAVAGDMTSTILGSNYNSQTFAELRYNAKHTASNQTFRIANPRNPSLNIRRIVVIATTRTCSASEEVITALQSFAMVKIVASTPDSSGRYTCGKPIGFSPRSFQVRPGVDDPNDPVVSAAVFRSVAANGATDYFNGMTPNCVIQDDLTRPVGDVAEAMLAGALTVVQTGNCPAGTTADNRVIAQSVQLKATQPDDPIPPRIGRVHQTW